MLPRQSSTYQTPSPPWPLLLTPPILSQTYESAREEADDVRAHEADYVSLDSDGEEIEYAEFSEDQLLLKQVKLKEQLAELAENYADLTPDPPDQTD